MARSRLVRPWFLERPEREILSRDAQLLYLLMQLQADDYGRLLDSPKAIAGHAFPLDETFTADLAATCLDDLMAAGWIRRYERDGRKCIFVERWTDMQKVQNRTESTLPDPESPDDSDSPSPSETFVNDSPEDMDSVFVSASVQDSAFASASDKEIVDSRVTTTEDPISSPPTPEEIAQIRRRAIALPKRLDANRAY